MFNHVVLGGTFDRLHKGHQGLIDKAFEVGKKVTIGLTSEKLIKNKFLSQTIESYKKRLEALKNYLLFKKISDRSKILKIDDIFGSTLTDKTIEAIVVSQNSFANACLINEERKKRKLPPLEIIVIPQVLAEDGELITSEKIRLGVMDRDGRSYWLVVEKRLVLPDYLRESLKRPLGKVIYGEEDKLEKTAKKALETIFTISAGRRESPKKPVMVIAVGDIISFSLEKIGFFPDVKIIDFRSRRKKIADESTKNFFHDQLAFRLWLEPFASFLSSKFEGSLGRSLAQTTDFQKNFVCSFVVNDAGTLTPKVAVIFQQAVFNHLKTGKKQVIIVRGEEDLTALVAILLAPLYTVVLYGQVDLGVVAVEVTEEKKKKVRKILQKFDK